MKTVQVAFLSDDYFRLSQLSPELRSAFALGSHVIALSDGIAYEIVDEGSVSAAPGFASNAHAAVGCRGQAGSNHRTDPGDLARRSAAGIEPLTLR